MVDSIINDKTEDAQVNFHEYLKTKLQTAMGVDATPEMDIDMSDIEQQEGVQGQTEE